LQTGHVLSLGEIEMLSAVVEIANEAYYAASNGDAEQVEILLKCINSTPAYTDYERHVAALFRGWVLLGCQKGMEVLKAAIDGTPSAHERSHK